MKFTLIKNTLVYKFSTIKAIKQIKEADLLIIDPFTDHKLATYAPTYCTTLVKTSNLYSSRPRYTQKNIVRLTEEISSTKKDELNELIFFQKLGYELKIISGISIINGISGENNFPLTIRGRNESFWVYDFAASNPFETIQLKQLKTIAMRPVSLVILHPDKNSNYPNERINAIMALIAQHRCSRTAILVYSINGTSAHTTLEDLMHGQQEDWRKNCIMLVINPCASSGRTLKF